MDSKFTYANTPLNPSTSEIRILYLEPTQTTPSNPSNPSLPPQNPSLLSCTLSTISLDNPHPPFTALSYTWSSPFPSHPPPRPLPPQQILLHSCPVSITGNLHAFLAQARRSNPQQRLVFWIDALCINQADEREKSSQIMLMQRVYAGAERVVVWLGPMGERGDASEIGDVEEAMGWLRDVGIVVEGMGMLELGEVEVGDAMRGEGGEGGDGQLTKLRAEMKKLKDRIGLDVPMRAIWTLFSRQWFYRTWTVQELCLAREVDFQCGASGISGQALTAAWLFLATYLATLVSAVDIEKLMAEPALLMKMMNFQQHMPDKTPGHLLGLRRQYQNMLRTQDGEKSKEPFTLMRVLYRVHSGEVAKIELGATNPLDHVYGVLAMANDVEELGLNVDYSLSVEEVFIDTALKLLRQGHSDILGFGAQKRKGGLDLPSWVPDWSRKLHEPCGVTVLDGFFKANGDTKVVIGSYEKSHTGVHKLSIEGLKVCCIAKLGTAWTTSETSDKFEWTQYKTLLDEVEKFCAGSDLIAADIYRDPVVRREAVVRTICFDQERVGPIRRRAVALEDGVALNGFNLMRQALSAIEYVGSASLPSQPDLINFQITLGDMFGKRPFLSSEGYVGLVPVEAEIGDLICIIKGAVVPFTVRQDALGNFGLLGETYVHGVMDGELVHSGSKFEIFTLV